MKKYLIILLCVFSFYFAVLFFNVGKNIDNSGDHPRFDFSSKDTSIDYEKINNSENYDYVNFNSEENLGINRGTSQRGSEVYSSYDEKTLVAMAGQWDITAIKELAHRYMSGSPQQLEGNDTDTVNKNMAIVQEWVDKRNEYIKTAVILGDKEFLHFSSLLFSRDVDFSNPDDIRKLTLDNLAFSEFMGMRGSYSDKYLGALSQIDLHQSLYGDLSLTSEDKQYIYDQARIIYDSFEKPRIEMGLGPFDNSISDQHVDDAARELKNFLDKAGDDAF